MYGYKVSTYADTDFSKPNSFQFYLKKAYMNQGSEEYNVDELSFKTLHESPWGV